MLTMLAARSRQSWRLTALVPQALCGYAAAAAERTKVLMITPDPPGRDAPLRPQLLPADVRRLLGLPDVPDEDIKYEWDSLKLLTELQPRACWVRVTPAEYAAVKAAFQGSQTRMLGGHPVCVQPAKGGLAEFREATFHKLPAVDGSACRTLVVSGPPGAGALSEQDLLTLFQSYELAPNPVTIMQAEPALVALVQFRSIEEAMAAMRSRHTMPGGSGAHLELRLMP